MKITEYRIVIRRAEDVEDEVNKLIKSGWQPFGSPGALPSAPESERSDTLFQAMVKAEAD